MHIHSSTFIKIHSALDFLPIVSTFTNFVSIITKIALNILIKCKDISKEEILKNRLFLRYIEQKSYLEYIFLMIPVINIGTAYVLLVDSRLSFSEEESFRQEVNTFLFHAANFEDHWKQFSQNPVDQGETNQLNEFYSEVDQLRQQALKLSYSNNPLELEDARQCMIHIVIEGYFEIILANLEIRKQITHSTEKLITSLNEELFKHCNLLISHFQNIRTLIPSGVE